MIGDALADNGSTAWLGPAIGDVVITVPSVMIACAATAEMADVDIRNRAAPDRRSLLETMGVPLVATGIAPFIALTSAERPWIGVVISGGLRNLLAGAPNERAMQALRTRTNHCPLA